MFLYFFQVYFVETSLRYFRVNNRHLPIRFRIATGRHDAAIRTKRDGEYDSSRECLLFGRVVDRLYLRSGLSSGRAQAEWQRGTSHVEDPRVTRPLLTREFTIARCSSFIGRHSAYIDREIRVERAACVRGRGYSRS